MIQNCLSSYPSDVPFFISEVENCCKSVKSWMADNKIKLKIKLRLFFVPPIQNYVWLRWQVCSFYWAFFYLAKDVCVYFDSTLSMEHHICYNDKSTFLLKKIHKITWSPYIYRCHSSTSNIVNYITFGLLQLTTSRRTKMQHFKEFKTVQHH